jgi:hypothetical protein
VDVGLQRTRYSPLHKTAEVGGSAAAPAHQAANDIEGSLRLTFLCLLKRRVRLKGSAQVSGKLIRAARRAELQAGGEETRCDCTVQCSTGHAMDSGTNVERRGTVLIENAGDPLGSFCDAPAVDQDKGFGFHGLEPPYVETSADCASSTAAVKARC